MLHFFTRATNVQPVQHLNINGDRQSEQVNSETTPPSPSIFEQFKEQFIKPSLESLKEIGLNKQAIAELEHKQNVEYLNGRLRPDFTGYSQEQFERDKFDNSLNMGIGVLLVSIADWGLGTASSGENEPTLNRDSELLIK